MVAEGTATFGEHVGELRRRLMWSLLFVLVGGAVGYVLHDSLLVILQRPLNETLYYTTPAGAFSFIIKICTVFGFLVALPVMTFNGFAFFEPLIKTRTRRLLVWYVVVSVALAAAGITFAYFVSLPAALHFLVNFGGGDIEALITANEYFNFVLAYLAGFALLFQLPLILTFINRLTPLTPNKLLGATRYVILASFILAAIITPTPDPLNQLLMAGPVILLYFLSAVLIVIKNRSSRRTKVTQPVQQEVVDQAHELIEPVAPPTFVPQLEEPAPQPLPPSPPPKAVVRRPAPKRINDIVVPGRNVPVPAYHRRTVPFVQPQNIVRPKTRLISDFIPVSE